MALKDDLAAEVSAIFKGQWTRRSGYVVPHDASVKLGKDGVDIEAAVLYSDMANSTALVDGYRDWFAAEIYKTFLHCAGKIVRAHNGTITAYDGDRIMAVFIGDYKEDDAVQAGMKIKWAVTHIINPARLAKYTTNTFQVNLSTGVDTSSLLVAKTGVRGANDLVWVGRAANYAAKLSALPNGHTYITSEVFQKLSHSSKFSTNGGQAMWKAVSWNTFDNRTIYQTDWGWVI